MEAVIDTSTPVKFISDWVRDTQDPTKYDPVLTTYANSARICQVQENKTIEQPPPFYYVTCPDNITSNQFYYDTVALTFSPVVNVPYPTE